MATRHKRLQVAFYLVEPRFSSDGSPPPTFEEGHFPHEEVLDEIGSLDIASGDYYMETTLFDQVVCFVHGSSSRILGAYSKDVMTAPMTEYKGELGVLPLRDDEGIVDPTFVAFFPNSVAGVLRCSVKAPGAATVANYISAYTGHRCEFRPLPSSKGAVQARLAHPDPTMHRLIVKAKRAVFSRWDDGGSSVAKALYAAGSHTGSDAVRLELDAGGAGRWKEWWDEIEPSIRDLLDVVGDLDVAKIEIKGNKRDAINLKRDFVTIKVPVAADSGTVTPYAGAQALFGAYDEVKDSIVAAVRSWRGLHG